MPNRHHQCKLMSFFFLFSMTIDEKSEKTMHCKKSLNTLSFECFFWRQSPKNSATLCSIFVQTSTYVSLKTNRACHEFFLAIRREYKDNGTKWQKVSKIEVWTDFVREAKRYMYTLVRRTISFIVRKRLVSTEFLSPHWLRT